MADSRFTLVMHTLRSVNRGQMLRASWRCASEKVRPGIPQHLAPPCADRSTSTEDVVLVMGDETQLMLSFTLQTKSTPSRAYEQLNTIIPLP